MSVFSTFVGVNSRTHHIVISDEVVLDESCSGRFSIPVEIMLCVLLLHRRLKQQIAILSAGPTWAQEESRVPPQDNIDLESPIRILNPVGATQQFSGFNLRSEDPL